MLGSQRPIVGGMDGSGGPEKVAKLAPEDRQLCVTLAYSLMTLCETNRTRFEALASVILDSVPPERSEPGARAQLIELLLIKGGKAIAQILTAAGVLAELADDIWIAASHDIFHGIVKIIT